MAISYSPTEFTPTNTSLKPTVFWRIAEDIPPPLCRILMVLSVVLPLLLWTIISHLPGVNSSFLPTPEAVLGAMQHLGEQGFLSQDIAASCFRVFAGFLLSVIVSIPLGVSMGTFASIRALFEPISALLRYMPAPAFIPLLIIYLGLDEEPKIALIFIGTVFFNTLMLMDAVKFVPKDLIETTYTLGGSRSQVVTSVILPYIVPSIIDTFRINIATSWNLVVVAELLAAEVGLGKRILLAQSFLNTDEIFACLIVLGVIGFLIDLTFRQVLRWTCNWSFE
ncbi:MAG: ABC transporter permease [Cyanobacteria bacterium P01_H01_bin.15]